MLARHSAPAAESGDLAAFLAQLDDSSVPYDATEAPAATLQRLGLVPDDPAGAAWTYLEPLEWFILLRGVASRAPALAANLSALRERAACLEGAAPAAHGWALHAERDGAGDYLLILPCAPGTYAEWRFCHAGEVRAVSRRLLHGQPRVAGACWASVPAGKAALRGKAPPGLKDARRRDALALLGGTLWRVLDATRDHAANRPMFGRRLVDFPSIQLRLLRLHAHLMVAEDLADAAFETPGNALSAAILAEAEGVRVDAQQICGGTGYLVESAFAASLAWLECCERMVRASGSPNGRQPHSSLLVWQRAQERLRRAGVALDDATLGDPLHTCLPRSARVPAR